MTKKHSSPAKCQRIVTDARRHALSCAAALLASAVLLAVSSTVAGAVSSYQGDDLSWDWSGSHITTCDEESDATQVKSVADDDAMGSGIDAAKDVDGSNGVCATSNLPWTIHRHKTCEYRSFWPDQCGNWQAT